MCPSSAVPKCCEYPSRHQQPTVKLFDELPSRESRGLCLICGQERGYNANNICLDCPRRQTFVDESSFNRD